MNIRSLDSLLPLGLIITLSVIGGVLIVFIIVKVIITLKKDGFFEKFKNKNSNVRIKKEKKKVIKVSTNEYLEALKGRDNILSYRLKGSRIEVCLKDYKTIDLDKLRTINGASVILMSNKLTLVIDGDAAKIYNQIFEEDPQ